MIFVYITQVNLMLLTYHMMRKLLTTLYAYRVALIILICLKRRDLTSVQ
jgi:hypothetical protein